MDASAKLYLGIALMVVMMGMGLSLTLSDFKRVLIYPKAVLVGTVNQIVILPLFAFFLVSVLSMRPELAVGLMVLAACPGGPTSNLITHLCKGDTALSVTLTALSSVITLFTIPFILKWTLLHFMGNQTDIVIEHAAVFKELLMVVLLPVAAGMGIRHFKPKVAFKLERAVKIASAMILFILIVGLCLKESDKILPYFAEAGLSTLLLNLLALSSGYYFSKLFNLAQAQRICIAIEVGIQNGTLAIGLCLGLLGNSDFAIPAAIYSLLMFITAFVIIWYVNRKSNSGAGAAA